MKALWKTSGQGGWARLGAVLLALLLALPFGTSPATAQEPAPRRNLFDLLFGGPRYERYERYEPYERAPRRRYNRDGSIIEVKPRPRKPAPRRAAAPRPPQPVAPPAPEPVAKLENARQILVVGDFMAGGLGSELENAFATSPGVAVVERSDGSSGLVRKDHFDWSAELPAMLDEAKPAIVVVMVGANDRQQMQIGGTREKFRSEAWFKEYETRVAELAGIVASRKLPLLWVGLPSFQSPSMMADAVTLNAIYRSQTEKAGGEFVDIWDGFVDEDGKFILTGSDVNGQQARLRSSDGITFTKAGKQKLAFYVEKLVRRHLGEMASPDVVKLDSSSLPSLSALPAAPGQAIPTHPISLSDPELDGGKDLLGAAPLPSILVETPRDKLVKRGELAPAPAGRIDDYRIPAAQ
ncbi:SGNH/GDSL hydrolase family protein [Neorhizobium petrolearium]|uniref:DUF459 domain-containing protein n=1 Tax=Neorhizobium petrolearium TaxID=515361 RepID=A0ABY8LZ38_9HYPH|nr:DUF459 domain-containing protein [Neorhizobium petrolearium]MCC2611481.1 DUF459 domain-containing protein [Neorhizobium petrolearium]WGI66671.1 DUF459 domain-containing protein [Neorhizobium petrolearium]